MTNTNAFDKKDAKLDKVSFMSEIESLEDFLNIISEKSGQFTKTELIKLLNPDGSLNYNKLNSITINHVFSKYPTIDMIDFDLSKIKNISKIKKIFKIPTHTPENIPFKNISTMLKYLAYWEILPSGDVEILLDL